MLRTTRKLLISTLVAVAAIAAVAAPGSAGKPVAAKTIGMDVQPSATVEQNTATTFHAKLYNTTPGNSNPNSFLITLPSGYTISNAVYASGTTSNSSQSVTWDTSARTVSVSGLDPLKSYNGTSPYVVIDITATTPTIGTCSSSQSGTWSAVGYTGSNLTGDTFVLSDATYNGNLVTTASLTCALAFDPAPPAGVINTDISTTVKVNGGTWSTDITLTVTSKPTGAAVKIDGSVQTGDALAKAAPATFTLSGDTVGSYTVQASSGTLTSVSATFELYAAGINCGGTSGPVTGGGTTTVLDRTDRGPNGDDTGCVQVPYTLGVDTAQVDLFKDQAIVDQQLATFRLTITWGTPPGQYGSFNVAEFDPDGVADSGDEYTPANCDVIGGVAQYPDPTATQHWCFESLTIVGSGSDLQATETYLGSGDPTIRYK